MTRKRYRGTCIRFLNAYNGTATFEVSFVRTTRTHTQEYLRMEMELDRGNIRCIYTALKAFADKEREAIQNLPL